MHKRLIIIITLLLTFATRNLAAASLPSNIIKWNYVSLHEVVLDRPLINLALQYLRNTASDIIKYRPLYFNVNISRNDDIILISATTPTHEWKRNIIFGCTKLGEVDISHYIGYITYDDAVFVISSDDKSAVDYRQLDKTEQFINVVDYLPYIDDSNCLWKFTIENGMLNLTTEILGW